MARRSDHGGTPAGAGRTAAAGARAARAVEQVVRLGHEPPEVGVHLLDGGGEGDLRRLGVQQRAAQRDERLVVRRGVVRVGLDVADIACLQRARQPRHHLLEGRLAGGHGSDAHASAGASKELIEAASKDLLKAAKAGDQARVRELLDKGADVDHASKSGDTALILSCQNGRTEAAALLLDRGAAIDHANNSGSTALSLAKSYGYTATSSLCSRPASRRPLVRDHAPAVIV